MHNEYSLQPPHFTVGNIDVVNVVRGKNYRHSYRNGRRKHGFVYVVKGAMIDTFSDKTTDEISLKAGDLIFIPKGTEYTGTYTEDETEINIIQFDLVSGTLPSYLSKPLKLSFLRGNDSIQAFLLPHENTALRHPFYCMSCLCKLLWEIDRVYAKIPQQYNRLKEAFTELANRCFENRPISYYAELCNMSEPNFRRLFRACTGVSPIEYRNDLRLSCARAKLQSGEYNVTEAAESSGFTNLSFFIRLYKEKFGHTPKQERPPLRACDVP